MAHVTKKEELKMWQMDITMDININPIIINSEESVCVEHMSSDLKYK